MEIALDITDLQTGSSLPAKELPWSTSDRSDIKGCRKTDPLLDGLANYHVELDQLQPVRVH